jgi:hypothetical protein
MDRSYLEPDSRLLGRFAWLHELLRRTNGRALASYEDAKVCRHNAKIWQASCLDRTGER